MHMSKVLPKIDFINLHRNMIISMCTAVCDANTESEMNIVMRINACKKKIFTCPCPCPFHHCCCYFWCFFDYSGHGTSWSNLFRVQEPITLSRSTLALLLTLGSDSQRRYTLKLLAYHTWYFIQSVVVVLHYILDWIVTYISNERDWYIPFRYLYSSLYRQVWCLRHYQYMHEL